MCKSNISTTCLYIKVEHKIHPDSENLSVQLLLTNLFKIDRKQEILMWNMYLELYSFQAWVNNLILIFDVNFHHYKLREHSNAWNHICRIRPKEGERSTHTCGDTVKQLIHYVVTNATYVVCNSVTAYQCSCVSLSIYVCSIFVLDILYCLCSWSANHTFSEAEGGPKLNARL